MSFVVDWFFAIQINFTSNSTDIFSVIINEKCGSVSHERIHTYTREEEEKNTNEHTHTHTTKTNNIFFFGASFTNEMKLID